jgi:hypothetical protein
MNPLPRNGDAGMVTKKAPGRKIKLKLKKDTIRDLDAKGKAAGVKGGQKKIGAVTLVCTIGTHG